MLRTILTFKNDAGWPCIKTTAIHALITSWLFDFKPTVLEWRGIKLLSTIVWTWSHYGEQCAITKRVTRWKLKQPELFLCSCSVQMSWHTHLLLSTSCGASLCLSVCLLLSCSFFSFQNIHNCIIAIMSLYMYFFWQSKHQALNLKSQIFFSICRFNRPPQCLRWGQCPDCPLANLASWTVHADILIYWKQTKVNITKGSNYNYSAYFLLAVCNKHVAYVFDTVSTLTFLNKFNPN